MSLRVFIADDNEILRGGLRALVNTQPDMEVVGEAANGLDAVTGVQNTEPDVVLMDLTMPSGGGLAAIVALKQVGSKARIVSSQLTTSSATFAPRGRRAPSATW